MTIGEAIVDRLTPGLVEREPRLIADWIDSAVEELRAERDRLAAQVAEAIRIIRECDAVLNGKYGSAESEADVARMTTKFLVSSTNHAVQRLEALEREHAAAVAWLKAWQLSECKASNAHTGTGEIPCSGRCRHGGV